MAPEIEKTYVARKSTNAIASGELFVGIQKSLTSQWLGQLGFSATTAAENLSIDLGALAGNVQIDDNNCTGNNLAANGGQCTFELQGTNAVAANTYATGICHQYSVNASSTSP